MTHAETLAYLKGMVSAMSGQPSTDQWNDIKAVLEVEVKNKGKQEAIAAPKRKH